MSKLKNNMVLLLGVIMLAIAIVFTTMTSSKVSNARNLKEAQIADLQNKISVLEMSQTKERQEALKMGVGLENERFVKDKKIMGEFLNDIFNWKTYKEYNGVRNNVMKKYKLAKDSSFMKVFLPEVVNTNLKGKDYNRIDQFGYNMRLESFSPYLREIKLGNYRYFVIVKVSSSAKNGGETSSNAVLELTIDPHGKIKDLGAVPIYDNK